MQLYVVMQEDTNGDVTVEAVRSNPQRAQEMVEALQKVYKFERFWVEIAYDCEVA